MYWTLDECRRFNAFLFDMEWQLTHIPTADRLVKVNGEYIITECPHCIQFDKDLKHG